MPTRSLSAALPLRRCHGLVLALALAGAGPVGAASLSTTLDTHIDALGLGDHGMRWGIEVAIEGRGTVYSREAGVPRSAASAIKSAIALDLLAEIPGTLDRSPQSLDGLMRPGGHPAFAGFTPEELARCRELLTGKTYLELARIMMGRTPARREVYNAACNLIMIRLGGPEAIQARIRGRSPAFGGIEISRYMETWNGDGDNRATPESLVALYRMIASGQVPALGAEEVILLRGLLLQEGDGGPGSRFEKAGTLYPEPMVRVHAGYVERGEGDLIYAVMGEIPGAGDLEPGGLFVRLMSAVDAVSMICRDPRIFTRD